jgi:hypothetical protein
MQVIYNIIEYILFLAHIPKVRLLLGTSKVSI